MRSPSATTVPRKDKAADEATEPTSTLPTSREPARASNTLSPLCEHNCAGARRPVGGEAARNHAAVDDRQPRANDAWAAGAWWEPEADRVGAVPACHHAGIGEHCTVRLERHPSAPRPADADAAGHHAGIGERCVVRLERHPRASRVVEADAAAAGHNASIRE